MKKFHEMNTTIPTPNVVAVPHCRDRLEILFFFVLTKTPASSKMPA